MIDDKDIIKGENERKREVEAMKQKVQFFFDRNLPIHIILNSRRFYNGKIIEKPSADFFLLEEFVLGEQPIFFIQIKEVEQFDSSQSMKTVVDKKDGNTDTREIKAKRH